MEIHSINVLHSIPSNFFFSCRYPNSTHTHSQKINKSSFHQTFPKKYNQKQGHRESESQTTHPNGIWHLLARTLTHDQINQYFSVRVRTGKNTTKKHKKKPQRAKNLCVCVCGKHSKPCVLFVFAYVLVWKAKVKVKEACCVCVCVCVRVLDFQSPALDQNKRNGKINKGDGAWKFEVGERVGFGKSRKNLQVFPGKFLAWV